MPAFHRRDLAVRQEPAGIDPLHAWLHLNQALFDPQLLREWERAWCAGLAGPSLLQLLDLSSELRRRSRQRRDDARRLVRHLADSAAARAQQRAFARRRRQRVRAVRASDELAGLLRNLRDLSLRWLEASLRWPFAEAERARWLTFWRRLAGRNVRPRARREPERAPRFDVFVQPDPVNRAQRIAAARRLREALLEALRGLDHAPLRLPAQVVERS